MWPSPPLFGDLSPALARFLKSELGHFRLLGGGLQGESKIWALTSGQGKRLFLKQPSAHAFERELHAYCDWLPRLPPATPTWVGYRRSPWRRIRRWLTQRGLPKPIAQRIRPPLNAPDVDRAAGGPAEALNGAAAGTAPWKTANQRLAKQGRCPLMAASKLSPR